MKKLITVFVVFALVAGTAFAETSVGGNVQMSTYLISGSSEKDSQAKAGGIDMANVHANVSFGDADAGGMLRLWSKLNDWTPTYFSFIWWKPVDWFRLQLGQNADGDWGHAQITGWGFNGEAQQKIALDGDNKLGVSKVARKTVAWAPGVDALAMNVSLYPVEGLSINLSAPLAEQKNAGDIYSHMYLNVNYNIVDIGTIRISSKLGPGYNKGDDKQWYGAAGTTNATDTTKLWLAFNLIAIDNLGAEIGLGFQLPYDNPDGPVKMTINHPVGIGLGLTYNADEFNFKFRFGMDMGGSFVAGSTTTDGFVDDPNNIGAGSILYAAKVGFNILPSYNLGFMTAYLNAGLGMALPAKDNDVSMGGKLKKDEANVEWYVNPYIRKDVGGVRLYAGIQIYGDNTKLDADDKDMINIAIPVGLQCYF